MTGAEAAVKTLKAHGLRLAFGIPGVQNLEYFDAFVSEGFQVVLVDANVEYRGLTRHAWGTSRALMKRTPPSVLLRLAGCAVWRSLFKGK